MLFRSWLTVGGERYYLSADGEMRTGLVPVGSRSYYLDPADGRMIKDGWVTAPDGRRYYLAADGHVMKGGWLTVGGERYYLSADGEARTGWFTIGAGSRVYLDPADGHLLRNGWYNIDGARYRLDDTGAQLKGLQYIDGQMYMLDKDSGAALTDRDVTLLSRVWHVDGNGVIEGYATPAMAMAKEALDQVGWNLYAAYEYAASFPYSNRALRAPEGSVHTEFYASYGFVNRTGNCYVMNAMLYQMAKLLGYEVYLVEGSVPSARGGLTDHGWCEIVQNGQIYVYDSNFYNETGYNGFKIQYGQKGTWRYQDGQRVG